MNITEFTRLLRKKSLLLFPHLENHGATVEVECRYYSKHKNLQITARLFGFGKSGSLDITMESFSAKNIKGILKQVNEMIDGIRTNEPIELNNDSDESEN